MATINLGKIKPLWRGDYSPSEIYRPLDQLKYSSNIYICKLQTTAGILPTNTTYFEPSVSGLGTAAAANVTTSATDTTEGRLLKVGDFGVGDSHRGQFTGDNNSIGSGFNAYFAVSSTNGFKLSDRAFTLSQNYGSAGAAWIAIDRDSGTPWFRSFDGVNYQGWHKGFHTGNILGTVSQSGGAPTGSIIERGSNANGEYVKFADGTLICTLTTTGTALAIGTSTNATLTWTFPIAFIVSPDFVNVTGSPDADVDFYGHVYNGAVSTTTAQLVIRNGTIAQNFTNPRYLAIGRWY
jgi:hypothetical protein